MLARAVRKSVSVPGCLARPGRSVPAPGCGDSFAPVRYHVGCRHGRRSSSADGRKFLVVTRLPDSDHDQAPDVEKAPQVLIAGRVVCSVYSLVVLAEELRSLALGQISQDHLRIGRVIHGLGAHASWLTLALRRQAVDAIYGNHAKQSIALIA